MGDGQSSEMVLVHDSRHNEMLAQGLYHFLTTDYGVDLDLNWGPRVAGGGKIRAHKIILEVFLTSDKLTAAPDEDSGFVGGAGCLDRLLEFLYNGRVSVRPEELDELQEAAEKLDFKMLVDAVRSAKRIDERKSLPEDGISDVTVANHSGPSRKSKSGRPANSLRSEKGKANSVTCRTRSTSNRRSDVILETKSQELDLTINYNANVINSYDEVLFPCLGDDSQSIAVVQSDERPSSKVAKAHSGGRRNRKTVSKKTSSVEDDVETNGSPPSPSAGLDQSPLECKHCDYKSRSKSQFRVHQAKRHDPSIKIFRCDACRRPCFSQAALDAHRAKHETYKCGHCDDFETTKRWNYYEHLFAAHQVTARGDPVVLLRCPECPFTCKANHELRYHTVTKHLPEKPFKCPEKQCTFTAGRKSDIGVHIKVVHLGVRKFLCEECGFRAVTPFSLERHKTIHTGLKPFECTSCRQSFKDRYALKRHSRLHDSPFDKPFVCHICGHAFNRRSNLKAHLKNVHKTLLDPVASQPP